MNDHQQNVFLIGYQDGLNTTSQRNDAAYEEGYEIGYAKAFGRGTLIFAY